MEMFIKKEIGKNVYTFVVEGKNLHDMVMESQKLSFGNVKSCGCCQGTNLILNARKAKDKFKYTEVKCLDCKASLVFGTPQDDVDTSYLRKNADKKYDWKAYNPNETAETAA